ncbi:MAG: SMP-30/gluconolactonase/LRE family protein, partial [Nitrospinota bacterium]|nr:SMP-30/gluconolactonase/LRE family protein [Nitrospinota bacterium]
YMITNGPAFIDVKNFFHTDSRKKVIYKIKIDNNLNIKRKKIFRKFSKSEGSPDGMTIDRLNNLWVCHFGGACISVFNKKGKKIDIKEYSNFLKKIGYIKKEGKNFFLKNILKYFFFLKFQGFNFKFFFFKKLKFYILLVGFGYSKKKKRFPRLAKIPVKIRKYHQFTISLRLFSIFSFKKYFILLMYLNINNLFSNEFILMYKEKILEEKYYIERR